MNPAQTSQDKGANSSTAQCCVCLGRVPRGCSRRHTSIAHEEATLQRCRSAAAVADACSPHKKMFTDVPSKQAFGGGLHPARTHAVTKARCAPRLRPGLRNPIPAPRAEERGLYLYGTCFPTAASERRRQSATDGIKVDKPLNNARVCTYRGIQTRQTQAHL